MSVRDAWLHYRANIALHFGLSTNEADAMIKRQDPETLFCAGYNSKDKEIRDFALGVDTSTWIMSPKVTSTGSSHNRGDGQRRCLASLYG